MLFQVYRRAEVLSLMHERPETTHETVIGQSTPEEEEYFRELESSNRPERIPPAPDYREYPLVEEKKKSC